MKKTLFILAIALSVWNKAFAKNVVTTIEQVTEAVTISEDVDYTITDAETPFTATGSINITNTEHAVVILKNIRPSKAISYLGFININGEAAVNDENCQVRMYAEGAIIFPYSKDIKPLTVYSGQNFEGESVNDFGLEHSGGYMNSLSTAKLNNKIRSFKLKRGYMVTFANNPGGRGYSRCFIADDADLEFSELPAVLDKRISSYRIFEWYNYAKKGIATDTREEVIQALNVTWCYDWATGVDRGPDCECVPHHIYEDWPSASACGSVTYSPHMQTNNEPGNSADDSPQSVETVLNNWENLMATGMRLCSPSSHDGSLNWLREFMDSIDARGWRCDILDMHCYWPEWNLNNALESWYNDYKRPIWVSEFVWGASWNNNGIFATDRTYSIENQQSNYNVMSKVLTNWNSYDYIERYAYWNSEADCSKIYKDGGLSILGEFYANMKSGIGYKKEYEFIPKAVYKAPSNFSVEYTERNRTIKITWNNANMEFTDSAFLELKINDGDWTKTKKYECSEVKAYSYEEVLPTDFQKGTYTYRIHNYDCDNEQRYTNEISISLSGANGTEDLQYGRIEIDNTEENTTYFNEIDGEAVVFMGLTSNKNSSAGIVNDLRSINQTANTFVYKYSLWQYGGFQTTLSRAETTDFMVMRSGQHQYGNITMEVAESDLRIKRDSMWIAFKTPFPEGVTPVVFTTVKNTSQNNFTPKVWNITNEGFAVKILRQAQLEDATATSLSAKIFYVAASPGTASIENGSRLLTVGTSTETVGGGVIPRSITFKNAEGEPYTIINPYILCGPQTNNYDCAAIYRLASYITDETVIEDSTVETCTGMRIVRQTDKTDTDLPVDNASINGDLMGWIIVSDNPNYTSITDIKNEQPRMYISNRRIIIEGDEPYEIYNSNGIRFASDATLPSGIYIVKTKHQKTKVVIK